jgi:lipoyl(octanoyl) transferase
MEWRIDGNLIDYETAVAVMEARAVAIRAGRSDELVWLLEHPPLYTAGTSAKAADLLAPSKLPVYRSGRGGQYTYHGPGQRVGYVMIDLSRRGRGDVRAYVRNLEEWIIRTLARFDVRGERRPGRIGIWVDRGNGREDKIAAIGVRIRHWVTLHGIAINLNPSLEHFSGIVPCGIAGESYGVTSLHQLGVFISMPELDAAMKGAFFEIFGDDASSALSKLNLAN